MKDKKNDNGKLIAGFEKLFRDGKLKGKAYFVTFLLLLGIQTVVWIALCSVLLPEGYAYYTWKYFETNIVSSVFPNAPISIEYQGQEYTRRAQDIAMSLIDVAAETLRKVGIYYLLSLLTFPVGFFASTIAYKKVGGEQLADKFKRGGKLITEKELVAEMRKRKEEVDLPIGNLKMPKKAEPKHVLEVGSTGVGKTVLQLPVIERAIERGDPGLAYDYKGDYVQYFYVPERDYIFNPLDSRCVAWSVLDEIQTKPDVTSVANSLIPEAKGQDAFFNNAARDIFAAILICLKRNGKTRNIDIWKMVSTTNEEIADALKDTPGCETGYTYFRDTAKSLPDIRNTMAQYTKAFEYMASIDIEGTPFTLRQWLENGKGWIFVTNRESEKDTLKPILSLMIDLLARKVLDMSNDPNRRIFFMLDEFGTLQRMSSVVSLLTGARSRGASVWIGIQDIGGITNLYNEHVRQTIVNNCTSKMTFNVNDPDTAEYLSRLIGGAEIEKADQSQSWGPALMRDGVSISHKDEKDQRIVTPDELKYLPELVCYVKFPNYYACKITLPIHSYVIVAERFIMRPELLKF